MPIIAIAGAPTTGKTVLAQYILKRLKDKGQDVQIVRNSVEDFFQKKYKENPNSNVRYAVNQRTVLSEQFCKEAFLDKTKFHVLTTSLFCNYCTALLNEYKEDEELMEKAIPGMKDKVLQCARNYDLIIFLEYVPSSWDYSMRTTSMISRYFGINDAIKSFLGKYEIKYDTFRCSPKSNIKDRNYNAVRFVEKKFGLSRKPEKKQSSSQDVSHETLMDNDDKAEKDQYLQKFWPEGFGFLEKEERIGKRKWNKRKQ